MNNPDNEAKRREGRAASPPRAASAPPFERRRLPGTGGRGRQRRQLRARGDHKQRHERHDRRLRRQRQRRHAPRQAPDAAGVIKPVSGSARRSTGQRSAPGRRSSQRSRLRVATGVRITHAGAGLYNITVTAASCRHAVNNAPVVSVNDYQPPAGSAASPARSPWRGRRRASSCVEAFTIHTGVVVNGAFQPRDESFNFTDSCG